MTVVDELVVKLSADSKEFVVGFGQAKGAVKSFKDELNVSMSGIAGAFKTVAMSAVAAGTAIAGSLVGAMTLLAKQSLEAGDAMAKLSDKTGVNIETLYGWKAAANNVGTSVEAVAAMAQKLQRNIAQAAQGNEQAAESFKRLGLDVNQLIQMRPEDAFGKVADSINKIGSQAERTNAGVEAFGRGFMDASLFVKLGSEGMADAKRRAEELGVTLNRFDAAKIEAVNDSFDELKLALEGIGNTIAVAVSPYLKGMVDAFTEGAAATGGYKQKIIDFVETTVKGIGFVLDVWKGLRIEVAALKVGFFALAEALQWAGGFLKNLGVALMETAKTGDAGFAVMVGAIKYGLSQMVAFVSEKLSSMLHMVADTMTAAGVKGANVFRDAAYKIGTATGTMAADSKKSFEATKEAAVQQAQAMRDAWTGMLDINVEHTDNLRREAIADLQAIVNEPLPSTQFEEWAARAKAKIDEIAAATANASKGSQTETGPKVDPVLQEELKKKVEAIRESLLSEEQAENESYLRKQEALTAYYADKAEKQAEWMLLEEGLTQEHETKLAEIKAKAEKDKQETQAWYQSKGYQQFQQYTGLAATLMNSHSRKMFEIGKVAAIGQAIVSTAAGAASALKDVPFPYNLAAMAAVIAAGAVQISTISSTSFGSRGGGGTAPSSPSITGGGATNGPVYGQPQQAGLSKQVTVMLQGDSVYNGRNLVDLINQQLGDGATLSSLRAT